MPVQETPKTTIARSFRTNVLSWLHLARIYLRVSHIEQALLAGYGLTGAQFDVLSHLASEPGLSQQALAGRLLVTKGNVSGLIDRLEVAGLLERRADPADRRTHRLYLTPAGEAIFTSSAPPLEAHIDQQFQLLDAEEQAVLMRLLARLDRALQDQESCGSE
jgi:DNA-binding MarR family transcriptional regulator